MDEAPFQISLGELALVALETAQLAHLARNAVGDVLDLIIEIPVSPLLELELLYHLKGALLHNIFAEILEAQQVFQRGESQAYNFLHATRGQDGFEQVHNPEAFEGESDQCYRHLLVKGAEPYRENALVKNRW